MPQWIIEVLSLPPEASTASIGIDRLHTFVIGITMLASVLVALMTLYFIARYQRKSEDQLTDRVVAKPWSEGLLISVILGTFVLWWVLGYLQYAKMRDPPKGATTVYVTAKQWMWKFSYPDGRIANDVLTVPMGKPIVVAMTSRDVIHSFYIPAFRVKQDVIPGRYTTAWFEAIRPGTYPIFCAEYCGLEHSLMLGQVRVLAPEDYERWLKEPSLDASGSDDLIARGARAAERRACFACHTINGQPHIGPTWAGLYGSSVTLEGGKRVIADDAYLTKSMMEPFADVVAGFKPVMPTYFGVLEQPEAAAIVEFIKSLRDAKVPSGVELPALGIAPVRPPFPPDDAGLLAPQAAAGPGLLAPEGDADAGLPALEGDAAQALPPGPGAMR